MSTKVRVALFGFGRMSQATARNLLKDPSVKLVLVASRSAGEKVGRDIGDILEIPATGLDIKGCDQLPQHLAATRPSIVVDFTNPEASLTNLKTAAKYGAHLIVGTTGYTKFQTEALRSIANMYEVSLVMAPNLSIGINMLIDSAKKMAKVLSGFDIEVIEEHHRYKKDAPSGTAIRLASLIAEGVGINPEKGLIFGRQGNKSAKGREIAIHAIRGGGTIGVHRIVFLSDNERIEIKHESLNRNAFTDCLKKAIKYVHFHPPGVYSVEEILGLETPAPAPKVIKMDVS
ncbi:MAG: 4-hydroxy-tetrahydrodipicolinate reductase [Desulfotomaculaceae bacterium]|nr:4-hydroxy-tetrahydrodipicolinate reductase [Desulfotomaculaceae bacterium]MDD4767162.1 4-hydroxy-tetrahydrodipicolinate reductase [Desulfotomaculaceae bacterium]